MKEILLHRIILFAIISILVFYFYYGVLMLRICFYQEPEE